MLEFLKIPLETSQNVLCKLKYAYFKIFLPNTLYFPWKQCNSGCQSLFFLLYFLVILANRIEAFVENLCVCVCVCMCMHACVCASGCSGMGMLLCWIKKKKRISAFNFSSREIFPEYNTYYYSLTLLSTSPTLSCLILTIIL